MLSSLKLLSRKNHFFFQCKQLEIQLFEGFVFKACIFNFLITLNHFQGTIFFCLRDESIHQERQLFNCELFKVFHLKKKINTGTTDYHFFLHERQLFDRFIKMLEHYISFSKQGTSSCYWKQCIYKNKKSIVNNKIKSVKTGYFCWKLIKSTTNEFCVPVVKFYFPPHIVYPHHILGIIFSPRKWPIQESLYVSTNCTFCTIN